MITIKPQRVRARRAFPDRIRLARDSDFEALDALLHASFPKSHAGKLPPANVRLVAEVDGRVVGHTALEFWRTGCRGCEDCDGTPHPGRRGAVMLTAVAVDHAYRRHGLAKDFIRAAKLVARQEGLPRLSLDVAPWNRPARRLYQNMGFRAVDQRPWYALAHGAAIFMTRSA